MSDRDEALYGAAVSFQAINASRHVSSMKLLRRGLYASIGLNLLLSSGITAILPLKQYVPIYGFHNEAGAREESTNYADEPLTQREADVENVLSQYVQRRERYAVATADEDYDVISRLSSDKVRREYQGYLNAKLNPDTPAKKLGKTGYIRMRVLKGADWLSHAEDFTAGTYKIRFCRTVVVENQAPVDQLLEEELSFETVEGIPADQRSTFNAPSIAITDYPPAREEGAPGAAHPCANL